jgi:hypothetical protein
MNGIIVDQRKKVVDGTRSTKFQVGVGTKKCIEYKYMNQKQQNAQ